MARIIGFIGAIVGAILSWNLYHHWGWAILHGFCGWLYVIYYNFFL